MKDARDAQRSHWQKTFIRKPEMFGGQPSQPARTVAQLFEREGKNQLLELGGGQGRDTLYFAGAGFRIQMLDYSDSAVDTVTEKARQLDLSGSVTALRHDVRSPLPFDDESFDACYSHMLYCMALPGLSMPMASFLAADYPHL